MAYSNGPGVDDLNEVPREQLGVLDPMYEVVDEALRCWLAARSDGPGHYVGTFLDSLRAAGWQVVPTPPPPPSVPVVRSPFR